MSPEVKSLILHLIECHERTIVFRLECLRLSREHLKDDEDASQIQEELLNEYNLLYDAYEVIQEG